MKKVYIRPSMQCKCTDFVCQTYSGSLKGIVPETEGHQPGEGGSGSNNPDPDDQYSKYRGNFYEGF